MKKIAILGLFALMVVGVIFSTGLASAYRGDYSARGPAFNEDRHEAMDKALETMDYDAWYDLMTENGRHPMIVDLVTEDNFAVFAQAHQAELDGDYETASQLRVELGLQHGNGPRDGSGMQFEGRGQMKGNGRMRGGCMQ